MSAALDKMGPAADRIVPIFISVDPARETPEVLKAYLSSFGTRFVGLTGTDEEIAATASAYRVYVQAQRPIGDTLAGMVRGGVITAQGSRADRRYVVAA